jgi:hypothetical protein
LFHVSAEFRLQQMPGVLGRFLDEVAGGFIHVISFLLYGPVVHNCSDFLAESNVTALK